MFAEIFKKFYLIFLLTWAVFIANAAQAQEQIDIHEQFTLANLAFRQANESPDRAQSEELYSKAIAHYTTIIEDGGVKNGKLYYNIGNAYLLKGDIGKAIVNYRRGLELLPGDYQIEKNLEYARTQRADEIELQEKKQL